MDQQKTKKSLSRQDNIQEKRAYQPAMLYKLDELPESKASYNTSEISADFGSGS
ncbi:MAG: hypothetical protein P1U32_09510 [Legionellaceae bacterium]|nr:hypothetical protein [Legionellaceae bacterium]